MECHMSISHHELELEKMIGLNRKFKSSSSYALHYSKRVQYK